MRHSIFTRTFWVAVSERALRGAIAALVGAYVAGNLVFDTTHIGLTLGNVLAIAIGGALSAFGLSVAGNVVSKNGPAFTRTEVVPATPVATHTRPESGVVSLLYLLLLVLLVALILWIVF